MREALTVSLADIEEDGQGGTFVCTPGCRRFFQLILSPEPRTTKDLARDLGVSASTLQSRFERAGLPSPKKYLSYVRLVWAAYWGEDQALTTSTIAFRIGASSPQSFGRMLKKMLGVTPAEFRARFRGEEMLSRFRFNFVVPFDTILQGFDPIGGTPLRMTKGQNKTPAEAANDLRRP